MDHSEGVFLRRPAKVVNRFRPVALACRINLKNGDDLTLLRLGQHVAIVEAPPGSGVTSEGFAFEVWIATWSREHIRDAYLQHIAGLGSLDADRAGADVHAGAGAGSDFGVHGTGTAPVNTFAIVVPEEDAFGAGIALDHSIGIVVGVVCQGFDGHEIARFHFNHRFRDLAEVAP